MFDSALTVCLLVLVPAYGLWRGWAVRGKPATSKTRRYLQAILLATALSALLAIDWARAGRPSAALGLQWPPGVFGWVGLGIAAVFLVVMVVASRSTKAQTKGTRADEAAALLPETRTELWLFILFSLVIGAAWEVLFRGYLIWVLEPRLTTFGAVTAAAAAYGLAHGYKTPRQFFGSLLAALLFTIAYILTRSLWWLMLIHTGAPLIAALARRHNGRTKDGESLSPEAPRPLDGAVGPAYSAPSPFRRRTPARE